ncbi:hypothetical protein C7I85_21320 [Mesorhizobium soli]|uniref:Uncharacterized protein n=1 Tax=Pseudaminobacter soli (ex Li et al. 2025) TaxID=1295366 RepID=A0A2P7S607_9HYPH|nr:hypothetical protein C7I85_21320 [Mesorhizobium soli]
MGRLSGRTGEGLTHSPKIGIDFWKGLCVDSKCYSVLCPPDRARGAVSLRLSARCGPASYPENRSRI